MHMHSWDFLIKTRRDFYKNSSNYVFDRLSNATKVLFFLVANAQSSTKRLLSAYI